MTPSLPPEGVPTATSAESDTADASDLSAQARSAAFASPNRESAKSSFRLAGAVIVGVIIAGGLFGYALSRHGNTTSSVPANQKPLSSSLANFMGLAAVPHQPAPNFTLTDQAGKKVSLSSLKGRSVVLSFLDTKCVDICPIISQELVLANADLGTKRTQVAFVAVNVNAAHSSTADVSAYTNEHNMSAMTNWYFLTGSVSDLRAVWKAYGVEVFVSHGAVVHSDPLYFIGPNGKEQYIATPYANQRPNGTAYLASADIARWAQGIAHYAGSTAP